MTEAAPAPTRHRRLIGSARTNLPRWPERVPVLDATAAGFVLVGVGEGALPVLAGWQAEAETLDLPFRRLAAAQRPCDLFLVRFDHALSDTVVGWRLMIVAPPAAVSLLIAQGHRAGLIDAEIGAFALPGDDVAIWCANCRTRATVCAAPGAILVCPGCGHDVVVHHHHSRRHAALVASPVLDEQRG